MKTKRALSGLALAAGLAVILPGSQRDSPAAADARPSFDRSIITRGAQLAAIGNCGECHTQPGGKAYAGGRAISTPFGTIYSTNITPDAETGIGAWTQGDFLRAMRDGIDRAGRNLYPAFPYDHFTRVTDDDVSAIYAFMMSRDAVHAAAPPNRLMFPMNLRPMVSAWKALFFERGVYRADPAQGARMESRRLPRRRTGTLRRVSHPSQRFGCRKEEREPGRRRSRRLACDSPRCVVPRALAVDGGADVHVSASRLGRAPRHGGRPDEACHPRPFRCGRGGRARHGCLSDVDHEGTAASFD